MGEQGQSARNQLALWRSALGMRQEDLQEKLAEAGMSASITKISQIEQGRRWIDPDTALKLAKVLKRSVGEVCEAQIAAVLFRRSRLKT